MSSTHHIDHVDDNDELGDDDEHQDDDVETKPNVKKTGRPILFAKEVKWKDIPQWWSRTDCPLLQLPDHVLNRCFALDTGLGLRDYVALSGVNRFFRAQFDDRVFEEVCIHHRLTADDSLIDRAPLASSATFSRVVPDAYKPKERHSIRSLPGNFYRPRGARQDWSKAQYTIYRQEREIHLATERLKRYQQGLQASINRQNALGQAVFHPPVKDGNVLRQVIGVVNGRRNGERSAKVGTDAGPQGYVSRVEPKRRDISLLRGRVWDNEGKAQLEAKLQQAIDAATNPQHSDDDYDSEIEYALVTGRKRKRATWAVPSTPEDSDSDEFEWDDKGNKVVHDFWPSTWRARAVAAIHDVRMNKKAARDKYKVSEAELLSLKHVLVHNPMNSTAPKQLFLEAAVEALAFRSHGGPIGHREYV
ncbi:hypothetical protein Q8F55_003662 [Vanrija albida]|uniref:F-box domain-containing protein n=1 Tax=Vanrija albida TaxID=181172 RepID=A0ABR3Q5D7_9TREE